MCAAVLLPSVSLVGRRERREDAPALAAGRRVLARSSNTIANYCITISTRLAKKIPYRILQFPLVAPRVNAYPCVPKSIRCNITGKRCKRNWRSTTRSRGCVVACAQDYPAAFFPHPGLASSSSRPGDSADFTVSGLSAPGLIY